MKCVSLYDIVNGQMASVVTWAGLYMDIGVDLNAKYAKESTYSGLRQHFHIQ